MEQATNRLETVPGFEDSQPFIVGFNPLEPLPRSQRAQQLEAYFDYLRNRDGEPNLEARTLSRREQFFAELDNRPVRWKGALDRDAFHGHMYDKPSADMDPKILWLLAAAKSNRVEYYGVNLDLELKGHTFGAGDHMTFIDLEEFYHTRILRDCCKCFDLEFDMLAPRSFTRMFAALVVRSPAWGRLVTALCGELFGCVAFQVLWERTDVFADEPAVMERLRLLTREILIDELGHTSYGHAMLGRGGLTTARALVPMISRYFLRDLPEFSYLAGGRKAFLDRVSKFDLGSNKALWER